MSLARIKEIFFRLPKHMKFIGIGALILGISTFLPWYSDIDSYKIGGEFLGVTGPAAFAGIAVLLLSGLSLWIFSYHLLERRVPRLPVREAIIHLFTAVESLFLLLIVNSIYFHPDFGVNITLKQSRFGMTLAVIGVVVLFLGGYMKNKEELVQDQGTGKLEPLIKMENQPQTERPQGIIHTLSAPERRPEPRASMRPEQRPEQRRGFLFGEGAMKERIKAAPENPQPEKEEKKSSGSYMHRMDL